MGRFTRDAPWLRKLFPASGTPATKQPSAVSEDVQLTNLYLAGGQVQDPPLWLFSTDVVNPGTGGAVTLLAPISFALKGPEVWRIFFMAISALTGPASDLGFNIRLVFPATAKFMTIVTDSGILTGSTLPVTIPITNPLILPTDQTSNIQPALSVNVDLFQTAGPAAASVTLRTEFYILRNPKGVAHYL